MKKKPIKVTKSLSLDKEILSQLDNDQLNEVAGGGTTNTCNGAAIELEQAIDVGSCLACSCNGK